MMISGKGTKVVLTLTETEAAEFEVFIRLHRDAPTRVRNHYLNNVHNGRLIHHYNIASSDDLHPVIAPLPNRRVIERTWCDFKERGVAFGGRGAMLGLIVNRCEVEGQPYKLMAYPGRSYMIEPIKRVKP